MDIETLLAKEEISGLRYDFAWYLDTSDPDALADLFWDDAVIDTGPWGKMVGQDAIRKGFGKVFRDAPKFAAMHAVTNPRIAVNGDNAEGTWYLLDHSLRSAHVNPLILIALYEETYQKRGGVWKYTSLTLNYLWTEEHGRITPDNPIGIPQTVKDAYRARKATEAAAQAS